MRPGAKLLVVDRVIAAGDESDIGKFSDLEMLVLTGGGRERTEAEFRQLYDRAGFDLTRVISTKSVTSVIEGVAHAARGLTKFVGRASPSVTPVVSNSLSFWLVRSEAGILVSRITVAPSTCAARRARVPCLGSRCRSYPIVR